MAALIFNYYAQSALKKKKGRFVCLMKFGRGTYLQESSDVTIKARDEWAEKREGERKRENHEKSEHMKKEEKARRTSLLCERDKQKYIANKYTCPRWNWISLTVRETRLRCHERKSEWRDSRVRKNTVLFRRYFPKFSLRWKTYEIEALQAWKDSGERGRERERERI